MTRFSLILVALLVYGALRAHPTATRVMAAAGTVAGLSNPVSGAGIGLIWFSLKRRRGLQDRRLARARAEDEIELLIHSMLIGVSGGLSPAALEFVLIMPLVFLVIVGMLEVAVMSRTSFQMVAASREGARVAAVAPDPARAIEATRRVLGEDHGPATTGGWQARASDGVYQLSRPAGTRRIPCTARVDKHDVGRGLSDRTEVGAGLGERLRGRCPGGGVPTGGGGSRHRAGCPSPRAGGHRGGGGCAGCCSGDLPLIRRFRIGHGRSGKVRAGQRCEPREV